MSKEEYSEKEALVDLSIINICIGLLKRMNKNFRQQSYLALMFANGLAWFAFSINDFANYTRVELLNNWATEIPTFVCASLLMFAMKKSHARAAKYKYLFNTYCGINLIIGGYWLVIDILNASQYSTHTVTHMAFITDFVRGAFSYVMLAYF